MKLTASIDLVWQLAAREAIAAEFKEIEPEHVFAAVLKFSELPANDLEKLGAGAEAVKVLTADVNAVREALGERAIDSTCARRGLRAQLGKGDSPFPGGTIHRSQASRELFDAAAKLAADAGSETLTAKHLLDAILVSPSSKMAQVLGGSVVLKMPKPTKTPLLDAVGRDLTGLAAEGTLVAAADRQAECKALLQTLSQEARKSVFLVAESDDAVRTVIGAIAQAIAKKNVPPSLQDRRIIDLTALAGNMTDGGKAEQQAVKLFAEAATAKEVILFVPAIEASRGITKPEERLNFLKTRLKDGAAQCICRVAPQVYEQWVKKDPVWKQIAEVMHVHDTQTNKLPYEL